MPSSDPVVVFRARGDTLTRLPVEAASLDEATLLTGHGTYSVFRLYPGRRVLRIGCHLERMRRSAVGLGHPYSLTDEWLRGATRRAVAAAGFEMPRVRLTVPYEAPDAAIIALEPFEPPPSHLVDQGVRVAVSRLQRENPRVKDSRFIETRQRLREAQGDAYEVLLCDEDGAILEGTTSNFYAVRNGALYTAGEGVLEGVSRSILLEVAPTILPVFMRPVRLDDLPEVREAMLTSASRGVVPIVQIGDARIGPGVPGPVTARLRARYDAQVEAELEPL